jgi:AhpC/TSA family
MVRFPTRVLLGALLLCGGSLSPRAFAESGVVRPAPSFSGGHEAGRRITLESLRGKPVILVIAPSPENRSFRTQMSRLRGSYERLASRGTLFFAAFTSSGGRIPSNIPFILADDPVSVASRYGIAGFAIAVIGQDGNLDCLGTVPLSGQRILDLMENNASLQSQLRR